MQSDLQIIRDWATFSKVGRDPVACRLAHLLRGDLFPFERPPVDPLRLLDEARQHPRARILSQGYGNGVDLKSDCAEKIRGLPLEQAAAEPNLHITLFVLDELRKPGRALAGLDQAVFQPMEQLWTKAGVKWQGKFWPILFVTGSRSATNYHIDPTATLTFHLFGQKRFHSLKEPERWCPQSVQDEYTKNDVWPEQPEGIKERDCLVHDNSPGDLVWIPALTPHWVQAGSFSANISFAFEKVEFPTL